MATLRDSTQDREFFLQRFGKNREIYEATQRCGRRRCLPRAQVAEWHKVPFLACKSGEKVELVFWSCPPATQKAFDEYNLTPLSWTQLYAKGFRWSISGEIFFPTAADELQQLVQEHDRHFKHRIINLLGK